jgi:hypothetical protein
LDIHDTGGMFEESGFPMKQTLDSFYDNNKERKIYLSYQDE